MVLVHSIDIILRYGLSLELGGRLEGYVGHQSLAYSILS